MVIAPHGRVWHKFGSSVGTSRAARHKSATSVFHSARSRVLLTRKHRPALVVVAIAGRMAHAFWLLVRGRPGLAIAALRGIASGLSRRRSAVGPGEQGPDLEQLSPKGR
jgi:hypothetical protein